MSFHHANNHLEIISLVLFAHLQHSSPPPKKKKLLGRKNIGGAFAPPKLCLCTWNFYCIILINNNLCFLLFKNVFQDYTTENNSLLQGQCILSMTAVLLQAFEKVRGTHSRQMFLVTVIVREYWNAMIRMPVLNAHTVCLQKL